jgi:hypothetical protein
LAEEAVIVRSFARTYREDSVADNEGVEQPRGNATSAAVVVVELRAVGVHHDASELGRIDGGDDDKDEGCEGDPGERQEIHAGVGELLQAALLFRVQEDREAVGLHVHHLDDVAGGQVDAPEVGVALGLVHVCLPDEHEGPHDEDAGETHGGHVSVLEHADISLCEELSTLSVL